MYDSVISRTVACQAPLSSTVSWSLLNSYPLSWWCCLCHLLLPASSFAFNLSQHQCLFQWVTSSHQVPKVLELQLQHQFFQWAPGTDFLKDGLVGSPCSPADSQESSPTPQFKSINSLAFSFFYSPTLISIHDYWKNHSFDYTNLCWHYLFSLWHR